MDQFLVDYRRKSIISESIIVQGFTRHHFGRISIISESILCEVDYKTYYLQPMHNRGGGHGGDRGDNFGRRRGGGGPHGGPNHMDQGPPGRNQIDKINEKLSNMAGPTFDLQPLEMDEKKFSGRTRLYVGNIGNDVDENDLRGLFSPYGETSEYFLNKEKNFAFVRVVSTICEDT
jgi:hypothetical protein